MFYSSRNTNKVIAFAAAALVIFVSVAACGPHKYVFPVRSSQRVDFSAGGHAYPATDLFTHPGAVFVAPVAGTVEDVQREDEYDPSLNDPEKKGGRWVSLIGVDGYRYYGSHLKSVSDEIEVGKKVRAGDVLGAVGHSGNAAKTPRHLHFGVSKASRPYTWKTRRGEIDPYPFLTCLRQPNCNPKHAIDASARK